MQSQIEGSISKYQLTAMKTIIVVLLLISLIAQTFGKTQSSEIPHIIASGVEVLKTSKQPPESLSQTIVLLGVKNKDAVFCQTCNLVMENIINYRRSGASKDTMVNYLNKLCNVFSDWGPIACAGYIDIEIDTALYIIDNKKDLTGARICAIYYQSKSCQDPNENKWSVSIPPLGHSKRYHQGVLNQSPSTPWKVLHLTDFHYDPLYQPGNKAKCDVPLCCQKSNGPASNPRNAAGYWGDYRVCDTPWHSIIDFMTHLTDNHEGFDFIYYTGDIISHKSWATSKDQNVQAIKDLFGLFKKTFKDTQVYPILGNHEPHPTDFYSPGEVANSKISTQWIFDLAANEWGRWLPNTTIETIQKGGYYTLLIKPGFRIVALNSNVCFTSNLWLIYDDVDPYDQLKWLVEVLTQAELDGEKVHILSHIPPGEAQCIQQWTYQFRRVVTRFATTITSQFNGHTHLDELRLFYDLDDPKKVINVAYNAGSFTTFVGLNPNYRIYDVDQTNFRVLDYDHYTYNLTEANENPKESPDWFKLYSFKAAYGLRDTELTSLGDLVERMIQNHTLVKDYFRFQVRESAPAMSKGCNELCIRRQICSIQAVEATSAVQCLNMMY